MKQYIEKGTLYKQTAEWEASALARCVELSRTPDDEMNEVQAALLRESLLILNERMAFKFDVADAPAADVRENVHGMWIIDEDGNIECSVCGHHGVGDLYCERCGARMDERDEE